MGVITNVAGCAGDWTLGGTASVTGQTGATNSVSVTIPLTAKELLIEQLTGNEDVVRNTMLVNGRKSAVLTFAGNVSSSGVVELAYFTTYTDTSDTLAINIARRSGGNITVTSNIYYR